MSKTRTETDSFGPLEVSSDKYWGARLFLAEGVEPERLVVPFAEIKAFYDPSVQFGLQFGGHGAANDAERAISGAGPGTGLPGLLNKADDSENVAAVADGTGGKSNDASASSGGGGDNDTQEGPAAEVVELDAFRKK